MRALQDLLAKKGNQKSERKPLEIDDKTVFYATKKVVAALYGERGSFNIHPETYQKKKLALGAKSSLWVNEVHLIRDELRQKINNFLGQEAVEVLIIFLKP